MSDNKNQQDFGWAPVGARLLREYSQTAGDPVDSAPTVKYAKTWTEIKALPIMQQLLSLAVQQMVMLHAVDVVPRGECILAPAGRLSTTSRAFRRLGLPHLLPLPCSVLVDPLNGIHPSIPTLPPSLPPSTDARLT